MRISVRADRCISCGACVIHCAARAISLYGGAAHVDPDRCRRCLRCIPKCYMRAIYSAPDDNDLSGAACGKVSVP